MRRTIALLALIALMTSGCETRTAQKVPAPESSEKDQKLKQVPANLQPSGSGAQSSSDKGESQAAKNAGPGLRGVCGLSADMTMGLNMFGTITSDEEGRVDSVKLELPSPKGQGKLLKGYAVSERTDKKITFEVEQPDKKPQRGTLEQIGDHNLVMMTLDTGGDGEIENRGLFVYGTRLSDPLVDGSSFLLEEGNEVSADNYTFSHDEEGRITEVTAKEAAGANWAKASITYGNDYFKKIDQFDAEEERVGGWEVTFDSAGNPTKLSRKRPGSSSKSKQTLQYQCD